MLKRTSLFLLLWLSASRTASAQDQMGPTLPATVAQAFDVWRKSGTTAGIQALTPNWDNDEDRDKRTTLVEAFAKVEPYAGRMQGYDVARILAITPHLEKAYLVLLYERQPVFLQLTLYLAPTSQWQLVTFNFHTDPKQVFPPALLDP